MQDHALSVCILCNFSKTKPRNNNYNPHLSPRETQKMMHKSERFLNCNQFQNIMNELTNRNKSIRKHFWGGGGKRVGGRVSFAVILHLIPKWIYGG